MGNGNQYCCHIKNPIDCCILDKEQQNTFKTEGNHNNTKKVIKKPRIKDKKDNKENKDKYDSVRKHKRGISVRAWRQMENALLNNDTNIETLDTNVTGRYSATNPNNINLAYVYDKNIENGISNKNNDFAFKDLYYNLYNLRSNNQSYSNNNITNNINNNINPMKETIELNKSSYSAEEDISVHLVSECKIAKFIIDKGVSKYKEETEKVNSDINHIFVCGSVNVGKKRIVNRLLYNKFNSISELLISSFNLATKYKYNNRRYKFQYRLSELELKEYKDEEDNKKGIVDADCILLVFDLTNYKSFANLNKIIQEIYYNKRRESLMLLIGNKSDEIQRKVSSSDILSFCAKYKLEYLEVSAKTNYKIKDIPSKICELIEKNNAIRLND